ncbi:hypothetical protein [Legionella sainthelensi]|uniref:hypothetical protein n=1 Tax=Legionella sainthelensi TaxID=28087 RepID=UPI000E2032CE|nr:hypothetical protein [Legionella sainthelensi]
MNENQDKSISQEPPKTDTTPKTDQTAKTDTVAPPKPDEITVPSTDGPKPDANKNKDKKSGEEATPSSDKKEKKGIDSGSQDPRMKLIDELSQMVQSINDDVNDALKSGMKKLGDKFAKTELGQALGDLKQELGEAKDRLKQAAIDGANEKWDELKNSENLKPIADTLSTIKNTVGDIGDKINSSAVGLVQSATEKVSNVAKKDGSTEEQGKNISLDSPKSSDVTPTQSVKSSVDEVDGSKLQQQSSTTKEGPEKDKDLEKGGPSFSSSS